MSSEDKQGGLRLSAEAIAKLREHWNSGGRLSDWQVARLLDIAASSSCAAIERDAARYAGRRRAATIRMIRKALT